MISTEYKIIDNVIYTPTVEEVNHTKGVGHFYYDQMKTNKNKIAQIDGITNEEDTFDSLLQRCVRTSLAMIDMGLKPGDTISLMTHNHLNTAVPYIASFFVGTIMSSIDPSMSVEESTYLLKQTLPKLIFASEMAVPLAEKVVERIGADTKIVVFGETTNHISFSVFLRQHKNEESFVPRQVESLNEVALIHFSSGSSGMPKAVCFSHLNMLCFTKKENQPKKIVIGSTVNAYWRIYTGFIDISMKKGCTIVIYPSFNMENPWSLLRIPLDYTFLTAWEALRMIRSEKPEDLDLKNLKNLKMGGSSISEKQIEEIRAALPHTKVTQGYGQSEFANPVFQLPKSVFNENLLTSVGTIISGVCYKVVDIELGKALGPNQVGELQIKSPAQFIGYYKRDSSNSFDSDGWFKTGDLFYYDENLYFYVVDRIGETFKFYDYQITPTQIEQIILNLEPVEIAVVIGIPHETECNHPMAVVKLKPGEQISAEEIVKYVEERVEDKKRLRGGVRFVDIMPMTASGKVSRFKLKKLVLNNEI